MLDVLGGECRIVAQQRGPRPAARIGVEGLAFLAHVRNDAIHAVLLDERQVLREARMRLDAVLRAADRPPEQHAQRRRGIRDAERHDARAAHAAAHEMRALDAEMLEQRFAVPRVMRPGDELDAAAGGAAFAPVEHDAAIALRQMIEQLHARIHALRAPLVDRRVEAAGRVHQQWRPVAQHLVVRTQPVDQRFSHA